MHYKRAQKKNTRARLHWIKATLARSDILVMYLVNMAVRPGKEFENFSFTRDKICYFVQMSKVIHRRLLADNFDMEPIF